jgi:hypothetical protein
MNTDLTTQEQQHVRAALRFLRSHMGAWAPVSKVLRFKDTSLSAVATSHQSVSTTLAFRIARFAKVGVDDVLTGKFPEPGTCPHCGHRAEDAT